MHHAFISDSNPWDRESKSPKGAVAPGAGTSHTSAAGVPPDPTARWVPGRSDDTSGAACGRRPARADSWQIYILIFWGDFEGIYFWKSESEVWYLQYFLKWFSNEIMGNWSCLPPNLGGFSQIFTAILGEWLEYVGFGRALWLQSGFQWANMGTWAPTWSGDIVH